MSASPSGLTRRLAAMLYDGVLIIALWFLATIPFVAINAGESVEPQDRLYQVALVLVVYGFFVGFWTWRGRTLGMQSWGLQLETAEGKIPGVGPATVRLVVSLVSLSCVGLGFLWQLWDKDKMTWHDRASGTRLMHYPKDKAS